MIKNIILLSITITSLLSCYKEDKVVSEIGKSLYIIEDSDDPLDKFRYEYFKSTGVYILYEYAEKDYLWDMSDLSINRLVMQKDRDILTDNITYLKSILLNYYEPAFMEKYFPLKILLADSVNTRYDDEAFTDMVSATGRSYLAIGRISDEIKTEADTLIAKGKANGDLWAEIIYGNQLIDIPSAFFSESELYYGEILEDHASVGNEGFPKELGFWSFNEEDISDDDMAPDEMVDVNQFVKMITTHTEAEIMALMEGFDKLQLKYAVLVNYVKDHCGVDLQEIGNKKII